jgi:hypothetical protein
MPMLRALALSVLAAGLVVGCGGGAATGDVSGTVSYEGTPVENGSIAFIPEDGNAPTAGAAISNGKFSATKVPVGAAKVQITGAKDAKKQKMYDDPNAPLVMTSSELLPPKYSDAKTTELRYEVKAGSQTKNFDLAK